MPLSNSPTFLALRDDFIRESLRAHEEAARQDEEAAQQVEETLAQLMNMPITMPPKIRSAPAISECDLAAIEVDFTFCDPIERCVAFDGDDEVLLTACATEILSLSAIAESLDNLCKEDNQYLRLDLSSTEDEEDFDFFAAFSPINNCSKTLKGSELVLSTERNQDKREQYVGSPGQQLNNSSILAASNVTNVDEFFSKSPRKFGFFGDVTKLDKENIAGYVTPLENVNTQLPATPPAPKYRRLR